MSAVLASTADCVPLSPRRGDMVYRNFHKQLVPDAYYANVMLQARPPSTHPPARPPPLPSRSAPLLLRWPTPHAAAGAPSPVAPAAATARGGRGGGAARRLPRLHRAATGLLLDGRRQGAAAPAARGRQVRRRVRLRRHAALGASNRTPSTRKRSQQPRVAPGLRPTPLRAPHPQPTSSCNLPLNLAWSPPPGTADLELQLARLTGEAAPAEGGGGAARSWEVRTHAHADALSSILHMASVRVASVVAARARGPAGGARPAPPALRPHQPSARRRMPLRAPCPAAVCAPPALATQASADALVASDSSFSLLAGVLSRGLVLSMRKWKRFPESARRGLRFALTTEPDGRFDCAQALEMWTSRTNK
jgi:hypothetical protein